MPDRPRRADAPAIDPITFEILRNAIMAAAAEMASIVAKSSYSTAVNEGRDFAGTIYDADGHLVAQSEFDLPAFVGLTLLTVPEVIREVGVENMEPGDTFMINDPYVASTHCNDIHFVKPVFYNGERVAFVASTAHWTDVGGVAPGSINSSARSCYEEGLRIPAVKIFERGKLNHLLLRLLTINMRQGWERVGDLRAQCASLDAAAARLIALIEKYGSAAVAATMAEAQNASERMARATFTRIPDGVYDAIDMVDVDITTGNPVAIRLKLIVQGDHAVFDLTESDGPAGSSINGTIAATTSAVFIGIGSILPPMPMNAGVMRAVEIRARPGSICWAQPPSAISTLGATSMECVIGATVQALSKALPERGAGMCSTIVNTIYAGTDTRPGFGDPFIAYVWSVGGMGGTLTHDGPNAIGSAYTATIQNIPVELQERRYPLLWRRYGLVPNSGGLGRSRGGLALEHILEFTTGGGVCSNFGNREFFGPPAAFGGDPGGKAQFIFNRGTENERNVGFAAAMVPVPGGSVLTCRSCGGGGYADPLDRREEWVVEDVIDEYVTLDGAAHDYGVIVQEIDRRTLRYEIDHEATAALRAERRAARATPPPS